MTQPSPQPNQNKESKSALRRLLLVVIIAIGFSIYSYGWAVTEINLDRPQEEQRQANVSIALRELLSPRIFEQDREVVSYTAPFLNVCDSGETPAQADPDSGEPVIILEPACAKPGDIITVSVYNAAAGAEARLRWTPTEGQERPRELLESGREDFVLDGAGTFTGTIEVPLIRGSEGQVHSVRLLVAVPSGPIRFSETATLVIDRMAQTIFMALVATTVAIPIAAAISFFAARNLMRNVRLSVGSMLMNFIVFSFGLWFGGTLLTELGRIGILIGSGEIGDGIIGVVIAFLVPIIVLGALVYGVQAINRGGTYKDKRNTSVNRPVQAMTTLIIALGTIFLVGSLAGLALLGGSVISEFSESVRPDQTTNLMETSFYALADIIEADGGFLTILGRLTDLLISSVASIVTAFALVNIANALFGNALRRAKRVANHGLGLIMGVIAGAILMGAMATLAATASLLGVLPVVVAGIMGGQTASIVYGKLRGNQPMHRRIKAHDSQLNRLLETVIFWTGALIAAYLVFENLEVGRSLVGGTLPSLNPAFLFGQDLGITSYLFRALLIGGVLGGVSAGTAGIHGTFPLGDVLYNVSRTLLNAVRSIEPLIMGLVFVIWVGIGPFAGVLALTLHSIAALGKLYSEQIENIDQGPIEALESTGANRLQTIIYAVVPQIVPPYIAFTMYRWDINVRMSTIIGFVGGGGIGLLLSQQINLLRYRDAGVAVLAIAIVVSVLDYASANIRERLT